MKAKEKLLRICTILIIIVSMSAAAVLADSDDVQRIIPADNVPIVYIDVDDEGDKPSIEDMNESRDHSVRCTGTVRIESPVGFPASDPGIECISLPETGMEIKGRGNSTWDKDKKPYKLKLDKDNEAALLGSSVGASRHWVLLANAYDRTLLKNRIATRLGADIDMPFTPRGVPVELMMRNKSEADAGYDYYGSYYLSEQVRVEESRVKIEELKKKHTDGEKITGGYLIQNGNQTDKGSPNYFETDSGEVWANHTPNFDPDDDGYKNATQMGYIRGYMQTVEDAIYETDGSYREYMDMASAAKYWLVMQASMNGDAYGTGSTYLYKKRGDPKMYWGPLWDFDFAWYYDEEYEGFDIRHKWICGMLYDKDANGFVREIEKQWPAVRTALFRLAEAYGDDSSVIDRYYAETQRSQANDLALYPVPHNPFGGRDFEPETDKEHFKAWILKRVAWLEKNINDPEVMNDLVHLVIVKDGGREVYRTFAPTGLPVGNYLEITEKEGCYFTGWQLENGEDLPDDQKCTSDMIVMPKYVTEEEATHATQIFLRDNEDYMQLEGYSDFYSVPYSAVPEDALDQNVKWTSSDEDIAEFEPEGERFLIRRTGDVTLTATLNSGASASMLLHVVKEAVPDPESISTEKASYSLRPGDYDQVRVIPTPGNASVSRFHQFESSDTDVVTVDDNGVIKAIAPGRAWITVFMSYTIPGTYDWIDREAKCEVIVAEEQAEKSGDDANAVYNALAAKYTPAKVKLSDVRSGRKKATVKWKKIKNVSGYQIRLTDRQTGKVKTVKIKQTGKLAKKKMISRTVKKLKKKRNYKIKVRAYRKVNGYTFYGKWSKTKTLRTG